MERLDPVLFGQFLGKPGWIGIAFLANVVALIFGDFAIPRLDQQRVLF